MTNTTTLIRAEIASKIAEEFKDISISGRWITLDDLEKVFTKSNFVITPECVF